jgi:hypothetical protein
MNIEKAKEIAISYLNEPNMSVASIKKAKEYYVFFFDYPDSPVPTPGAPIVMVNAATGNAEFIEIPSKKGFQILNEAKEI